MAAVDRFKRRSKPTLVHEWNYWKFLSWQLGNLLVKSLILWLTLLKVVFERKLAAEVEGILLSRTLVAVFLTGNKRILCVRFFLILIILVVELARVEVRVAVAVGTTLASVYIIAVCFETVEGVTPSNTVKTVWGKQALGWASLLGIWVVATERRVDERSVFEERGTNDRRSPKFLIFLFMLFLSSNKPFAWQLGFQFLAWSWNALSGFTPTWVVFHVANVIVFSCRHTTFLHVGWIISIVQDSPVRLWGYVAVIPYARLQNTLHFSISPELRGWGLSGTSSLDSYIGSTLEFLKSFRLVGLKVDLFGPITEDWVDLGRLKGCECRVDHQCR